MTCFPGDTFEVRISRQLALRCLRQFNGLLGLRSLNSDFHSPSLENKIFGDLARVDGMLCCLDCEASKENSLLQIMFNEDEESDGTGDGSEEYLRRADFQNYTRSVEEMDDDNEQDSGDADVDDHDDEQADEIGGGSSFFSSEGLIVRCLRKYADDIETLNETHEFGRDDPQTVIIIPEPTGQRLYSSKIVKGISSGFAWKGFGSCSASFMPSWHWKRFDCSLLMSELIKTLINDPPDGWEADNFLMSSRQVNMQSPSSLSYKLLNYLPLDRQNRQKIIAMVEPSDRIRYLLQIVKYGSKLIECKGCGSKIAERSNIISIETEFGESVTPFGNYCNPNGFVHGVLTVSKLSHNR